MFDFRALINEFDELEEVDVPLPTVLEISGYPHYEKVASNILTFYLDNRNPHHFDITLVKSLLAAVGLDLKNIDPEELQVHDATTEVATYKGKFIDIVIETGSYLIGIENKIYADEYNPFCEYEAYIEKMADVLEKKPVLILLTLKKYNYRSELPASFKRITYENLFREFEKRKQNENEVNSKYFIFFKDFIQTILNMGSSKFSDEEIEFLSNKHKSLIDLHKRFFLRFEKYSSNQLKIIDQHLAQCKNEYGIILSGLTTKRDQLEAVSFYEFENLQGSKSDQSNLIVKLRFRPDGWYIEVWDQKYQKELYLKPFLEKLEFKKMEENNFYENKGDSNPMKYSYICDVFDLKEQTNKIADALRDHFEKIANHKFDL